MRVFQLINKLSVYIFPISWSEFALPFATSLRINDQEHTCEVRCCFDLLRDHGIRSRHVRSASKLDRVVGRLHNPSVTLTHLRLLGRIC